MIDVLRLRFPWSLTIPSEQTRITPGDASAWPDAANGLTVFVASDDGLLIDGDPHRTEQRGRLTTRRNERQALLALPFLLHGGETLALRHPSWPAAAEVTLLDTHARPRQAAAEGDEDEPGGPCFRFLLALVGRMRDFEAALEQSHMPWAEVRDRWIQPVDQQDPTMDVLVRHARAHRTRWADIVERPRRILNRRRELVPLSRAEELDTHCMAWLSRQPGTTLAERAGGRHRILALSRYENPDTLENRVCRDLMERSASAARAYLRVNAGRSRTSRYSLVERYARECRRLARDLADAGVRREAASVQPNYVLLQDRRYGAVWTARQEILRRERIYDDLWQWQHRAWDEFCRAACIVALLASGERYLIAASPLFFREEHRRGEWLSHDDPLAVLADPGSGLVVEVLRGDSPYLAKGLPELGAAAWLRIADMTGGDRRYVAVWALHGPARAGPLDAAVGSAAVAVTRIRSDSRLAGGLVLRAQVDPDLEVARCRSGKVAGLAFGPGGSQLADGLGALADLLLERIGEAA
jgi:hypothetical protein